MAVVLSKLPAPDPGALVSISATDGRTGNYSAIFIEALRVQSKPARFL
ncbi:MAG: hypothetical protein ABI024_11370 [Vicinamibacterales bacterium]